MKAGMIGLWMTMSVGIIYALPLTWQAEQRSDGAVRLTTPSGSASDQNPAFGQDGEVVYFTRFLEGYNDGPSEIYLLDYRDGEVERIVSAEDSDNVILPGSSWNTATGRIAFSSDREDTDEIWTMNEDGGDLFRVTYSENGYALEPSFSADGQWIVFERGRETVEGEPMGSLWKVRTDGTELRQLTDGVMYDDRQPNWSPVDQRIVFQRREPGSDDWNLFIVDADSEVVEQVTSDEWSDTDVSWSPDGEWLVYSSDYGGLELANLFIISAEGGDPIRATFNNKGYDGAPSWSADGMWLAFESGLDEQPTAIWRINVPGLGA
jgi:TolB protein